MNKILWFSWKDLKNPLAGGAELVNERIAERLVKKGCQVVFIVAGFPGAKKEEFVNGYKIIRVGTRWSVYYQAFLEYKKNWKNWADIIIEEVNTIPFFTQFYAKEKKFLLIYQLCRKIWFHQIFFPLSLIGYILEPIYLWILKKNLVITESMSTKNDLQKYGFEANNINIIPMASDVEPIKKIGQCKKYNNPTILSFGNIRSMKRTLDQIKAFELSKINNKNLKLVVAGDYKSSYGLKIKKYIKNSLFKEDIKIFGQVSKKQKIKIMKKSHVVLVSSIKEGWGLVVTESAGQGTPAIVYNVDGLRDSVIDGKTGLICEENSPEGLSLKINELFENKNKYEKIRNKAWLLVKKMDYNKTCSKFFRIVTQI